MLDFTSRLLETLTDSQHGVVSQEGPSKVYYFQAFFLQFLINFAILFRKLNFSLLLIVTPLVQHIQQLPLCHIIGIVVTFRFGPQPRCLAMTVVVLNVVVQFCFGHAGREKRLAGICF